MARGEHRRESKVQASRSFGAKGLSVFAVIGLSVLVGGCKMKDAEKCQQALETARKAAEAQDSALMTQWREYAYKHCEDGAELQKLDQDLTATQAAQQKRKAEEEQKKRAHEQRIALFQQWVATNRATPDRSAVTVRCDGEDNDDLKKSQERFCTRERGISGGAEKFFVRYWEKTPQVARFEFTSPDPLSCDTLGPNRVVRQLSVQAVGGKVATRVHCEINSGVLAGMQALVTQANGAQQYVFAPEYLEKDPGFAQKLR